MLKVTTEMNTPFDEAYFMDGVNSGKSNYVNYSWMPERTIPFANALADYFKIPKGENRPAPRIIDIGCSRGFLVHALRLIGRNIASFGYDISEWAIQNCQPEIAGFVGTEFPVEKFDFSISKDCCEHFQPKDLDINLSNILDITMREALFIVPLADLELVEYYVKYLRAEDNKDSTHLICWTLGQWVDRIHKLGRGQFIVSGTHHIDGLKPTSMNPLGSCGFISARRVPSVAS